MTDNSIPKNFEERLEKIKSLYPDTRSAVMPALYLAQEHYGWISQEAVLWVANRLSLPPVQVMEVATFYTMYYKKPVGKYHVQVCRTLSCALRGSKDLSAKLKERFNLNPNEVSKDGMWSYEEVECLGSCGTAPMCEINDVFFENLTPQKLDQILDKISSEKPELRYKPSNDSLGSGFANYPKSEVM